MADPLSVPMENGCGRVLIGFLLLQNTLQKRCSPRIEMVV